MPRTRSLKWSELKIGIMAVAALLIAAALILALGGEGGFFWQRYSLKVKFPNAGGVQQGSPVRVSGVTVGSVTDIEFIGSEVEMAARIARRHAGAGEDHIARDHRVGVAARRGRRRHQRHHHGPADPGVGLCARQVRPPPQMADVTAQASKGISRADRADRGHAGRQGHGRQTDDRRAAVRRPAAVHGGRARR